MGVSFLVIYFDCQVESLGRIIILIFSIDMNSPREERETLSGVVMFFIAIPAVFKIFSFICETSGTLLFGKMMMTTFNCSVQASI